MFDDPSVISLDCGGRALLLDRPRMFGIVNVTPDSFSDGGRHGNAPQAIAHGLQLLEEGADVLDIGGESTRPGAAPVSVEQELERVVPVIEGLRSRCDAIISIDTSKPEVMRAAVAAGAGLINDVRALRLDGALEAASALSVPVCLMHMRGDPADMQHAPEYDDVLAEVHRFLADRMFACELSGIPKTRVLLDPGIGFGKRLPHNLALLANLDRLRELGRPLLVGVSRKSMIGEITGRGVDQRVPGSLAAAVLAVQGGAAIIRTHDVAATRDALRVASAVGSARIAPRVRNAAAALFDDE